MANGSEYRLNLKAVLDTSQVQQELDKLKRAQQAEQGGGGGSSSAAAGERFASNFSKLDQTLQRLNQSVQRLQRSVEQLNRGNQKAVQQVQSSGAGMNGLGTPAALAGVARGYSQKTVDRNWLQSAKYARMNAEAVATFKPVVDAGGHMAKWLRGLGYGTSVAFLDNMSKDRAVLEEGGITEQIAHYNQAKVKYNNQLQAMQEELDRKRNQSVFRQNRQIAGLVAGQLVGGAADIATDLGLTKTGTVLGAIGGGISAGFGSAMTVSMMGGGTPLSIGVGAVVGLGTAATQAIAGLEKLAQAAADVAEAQRKRGEALIRTGVELQRSRSAASQEWQASIALEEKDKGKAEIAANWYKGKYDAARVAYFGMLSPTAFNELRIEQGKQLIKKLGLDDDEDINEVWKAANDDMAAYQLRFEAARKEMEQAKHLLDVWKGVTKELEHQEELEKKKEELERKQVEARRKSAQNDAELFARRAIGAGQVNATERFMIDVMHDRKKSPLTQFTMISKELDDLREQRNKRLEEAYGLNRQIQKEVSTAKPERLDELSKARGLAMEQADFLGRRIDVLEGALKDITSKVAAPDFSHMTSLAQYGFNMGEAEDTDRVMQDYYGKMTDLTKQIRDKLDQGIKTQATYSE